MSLTISSPKGRTANKSATQKSGRTNSEYVIGEINAFIAIRDELLAEAEETTTESKLHSLIVANDFVETCLTPARSPYDMQFLPESDAQRERQRCEQIKHKVEDLRSHLEVR